MTARMFGQRPSALLGIEDSVLALNVDMAACALLGRLEAEARDAARGARTERVVL